MTRHDGDRQVQVAGEPTALRALLGTPTARRVGIYCLLMLAIFAGDLVSRFGARDGWIIDAQGQAKLNDFVGVWAAGRLVLGGMPAAAYDWELHGAVQAALRGGSDGGFFAWPYPPYFLAVAGALAVLPFGVAMVTWLAATFAGYVAVLWRIGGAPQVALALAACPVTLTNWQVGQNGFFSAGLLGGGLVLLPSRPVLAGVLFGLLSYKPHLGLMVPIALIGLRAWRTASSAAVTVVVLCVVSLLLFGAGPWQELPGQLQRVAEATASGDWVFKLQSLYGVLRTVGLGHGIALPLHALLALVVAGGTFLMWRSGLPYALKAAGLAVASVLVSPYQFVYDQTLLMVAVAFLAQHGMERPLQRTEIVVVLAACGLFGVFSAVALPVGFAATLVIGWLVWRRVAAEGAMPATCGALSVGTIRAS